MKGMIFDIQHFSLDDGPGIRTTVFLKGCPLRCAWCHNPEGLHRQPQLGFYPDKCLLCGRCLPACTRGNHHLSPDQHQIDRENCISCGACANACPAEALKILGREAESEEILEDVLKDRLFYENSGGGITLSGGEPFYQPAFMLALLKGAKEAGLHTCVETSGFCSRESLQAAAPYTDLFLFDIKETDAARHKEYTGVDLAIIHENAGWLSGQGKEMILRCPLIPGYNLREDHILGIAALARKWESVSAIHLEPYHPLGVDKYMNLGMEALCADRKFLTGEAIQAYQALMEKESGKPVIIS